MIKLGLAIFLLLLNALALAESTPDSQDLLDCVNHPAPTELSNAQLQAEAQTNTFQPGKGFTVGKNKCGSLNISGYMLARYLNQMSSGQTYRDHLGTKKNVVTRNDFEIHRVLVWMNGFLYTPKLYYSFMFWSLNSVQTTIIAGNLLYKFHDAFTLGFGIDGIPGTRSMNGEHPYFLGTDRQLADEYFRPGFTTGISARGALSPKIFYRFMVGNNISQLGVTSSQLTRDFAYGGTIWWMPTTGEFGPKGGFGDYEMHKEVATRFGISGATSREDRATQVQTGQPSNVQVRISDGNFLFEEGALAPGAIVQKANYNLLSADAAMKYRGFFLFGEYYWRQLSNFKTLLGNVPSHAITDTGFTIQSAYQVLPQKLELYLTYSKIWGEFNNSSEIAGGTNYYPTPSRNFRVNGALMVVDKSAAGGSFGYYTAGQSGTILTLATDIFF